MNQENENLQSNKTNNNNDSKNSKQKNKIKSASFFKLQYYFLTKSDKYFLILAILGSFGTGIALPLFSLFFGQTISQLNNITSTTEFVDYFFQLCLKFIYVGIGTLAGGIMMYYFWTYLGMVS